MSRSTETALKVLGETKLMTKIMTNPKDLAIHFFKKKTNIENRHLGRARGRKLIFGKLLQNPSDIQHLKTHGGKS